MAKKRQAKVEVANKSSNEKLLVVTISLLSALLILNIVTLTGFSTRFSTDYKQTFTATNPCERVGGIIFREGVSANFNGNIVMLETTSDDAVAVEVNDKSRSILSGHEVWINGVTVRNFVSSENDACLVLS